MTRREARSDAFCLIFEQAVSGEPMDSIIQSANLARDLTPHAFSEALAYGTESHQPELDQLIARHLHGWSIRRISKVALALLRMSAYELLYEDTPASVTINEAVELAKIYGGEGDSAYINGVLGSLSKALEQDAAGKAEES